MFIFADNVHIMSIYHSIVPKNFNCLSSQSFDIKLMNLIDLMKIIQETHRAHLIRYLRFITITGSIPLLVDN